MLFTQIDQICAITAGQSITATKNLTLAESYLQDHFPRFPVMPGVLMLEALFQAGSWLVRYSEDFRHSMVVLREARQVKYNGFVEPGQQLVVAAEMTGSDERTTQLKAHGRVNDRITVAARLVLERYNLADRQPDAAATDQLLIRQFRQALGLLMKPAAARAG